MAFRLNQGGKEVWAEAEPGKKEDLISGEEVFRVNLSFQKRKGSVFPVKKKLVKRMMVDCIAKSLCSVLSISPDKASLSSKVGLSSNMSLLHQNHPKEPLIEHCSIMT